MFYLYQSKETNKKISFSDGHSNNYSIIYDSYNCFMISINSADIDVKYLQNLFLFKNCLTRDEINMNVSNSPNVIIGPRLETRTAWSTNIENICKSSNYDFIDRVEKVCVYYIKNNVNIETCKQELFKKLHDKMTEEIYPSLLTSFNSTIKINSIYPNGNAFSTAKTTQDKYDLLDVICKTYGLSFDTIEKDFIVENVEKWNNSLFMILDLAQSNS